MRSAKASIVELDKGKRYRVFVEAGRDPNTGKRIRLTRTVRGGRKAAEEAKAELLAMAGESSAARADITLESFWSEMYLPGCEARLRPTTVSGYKKDYKTYVKGPLGGLKLSRLTPVVVSRWLDGIPDAVKKHRACKMLKMILARAVKLDLMDYNPCDRVELPKRRRYRPEVLDAACVLSDGSAASEARMLALRAMSSGEPERFRDILSFVDREMAGNSSGTQAVTSMLMQDSCRRPYGIERVRKGYYRLIDPEDYWWIDLDQIKISSDMDFEG